MGLPLNLFKITLKLHHLLNTQNASALQQLLHLYLKQNKKQTKRKKEKKRVGQNPGKYIQNAWLFCFGTGSARERSVLRCDSERHWCTSANFP